MKIARNLEGMCKHGLAYLREQTTVTHVSCVERVDYVADGRVLSSCQCDESSEDGSKSELHVVLEM